MKKIISWIKNKFKKKSTQPPKMNNKQIIAEMEILLECKRLLTGFETQYPHLYKYNKDKYFWACFVTACAYVESGYDRFCEYLEPAPLNYHSLGLLQLSHVDQNWYKFCDIQGKNIFEVENNLECGIGILNVLLGKYKKPVFNKGHYWSVLMPKNSIRHNKFLNKFSQLCAQEGVDFNGKF